MKQSADRETRTLPEILSAAAARLDAGRPAEAMYILKAGDGVALANPVGRNLLGEVHLMGGSPLEALGAFEAALALAPQFAEAHANRAAALIELRRPGDAVEAAQNAVRIKPELVSGHFNGGLALAALARWEEAIVAFGAVLDRQPDQVAALVGRGNARLATDQPMLALTDFHRAAQLSTGLAPAHLGIANAYRTLGLAAEARTAADRVLAIDPGNTNARAIRMGAGAGPSMRTSPRLRPYQMALDAAEVVIRAAPNDPAGYLQKAEALSELGDPEEALVAVRAAEQLGASGSRYHDILAILLADLGDPAEAERAHRRALALEPNRSDLRYHYAQFRLSRGDLPAAWTDYEERLDNPGYRALEERIPAQRWRGENLAGKHILVVNEQGNGDTIQFARFATALRLRGAEVTLLVPQALASLLSRSLSEITVTGTIRSDARFDYQIAVMSLPHALNLRLADLPGRVPYLFADTARVARWSKRLGEGGFRVGIAWQGYPDYFRDRYRSVPLARFAPLAAVPGVRLISVQAVQGLDQLATLPPGMRVESFGAEIGANPGGFEEIAALMANLDLVVTTDTVTAHLAGALGRPTWVALRDRPDWRWMADRPDSPWYPTMRLFRQRNRGDWDGVFRAMAASLADTPRGSR